MVGGAEIYSFGTSNGGEEMPHISPIYHDVSASKKFIVFAEFSDYKCKFQNTFQTQVHSRALLNKSLLTCCLATPTEMYPKRAKAIHNLTDATTTITP